MKRLMVMSAVVVVSLFLLSSIVLAQDFCKGNFDYDQDVDGTDASVFKQSFGRSQFLNPCPPDGPAPVEKTWQSTSYAGGDDGWYQKGIFWYHWNRFIDNGNGTVTDSLTGLIWLKDANCFGAKTWSEALYSANGLSNGWCGLTDSSNPGDWRLPNVKELLSLIDYDYLDPPLPQMHPFNNVVSSFYWSSTTAASDTIIAWYVYLSDGVAGGLNKLSTAYVWPVRGGHNF